MAYKITFDENRIAEYRWSNDEQQSSLWKKAPLLDQFIIKPTGRNIWSKPFRHNVTYTIYDYLLKEKRRAPLCIIIECDAHDASGTAIDIIVAPYKMSQYKLRKNINDTFNAIIAADVQYSKAGGGVTYFKNPLHRNKKLQEKLMSILETFK